MKQTAARQLPLRLPPKIRFLPEEFIIHQGVTQVFHDILSDVRSDRFSVSFLEGNPRSGKTHFLIALASAVSADDIDVYFFQGAEIAAAFTNQELPPKLAGRKALLILDDVDAYLGEVMPGHSGGFVNLVETLRQADCSLVVSSMFALEDFPCDEHVMSRLRPGQGFSLQPPSEDECNELILRLAKQRGVLLDEKKAEYITRRLGRDVGALETYLHRLAKLSAETGSGFRFPLIHESLRS